MKWMWQFNDTWVFYTKEETQVIEAALRESKPYADIENNYGNFRISFHDKMQKTLGPGVCHNTRRVMRVQVLMGGE